MLTTFDLATGPKTSTVTDTGVVWVPALPLPHPTIWTRLKDAWEVVCGRAEAVRDVHSSASARLTRSYNPYRMRTRKG